MNPPTTCRSSEDSTEDYSTRSYLAQLGLEGGMRTYATLEEAVAHVERLEAAAFRLAPRVQRLEGYTFRVPSERGAGKSYLVDLTRETCECHSWRSQNLVPEAPLPPLRCKHVVAALIAAFGVIEEAS